MHPRFLALAVVLYGGVYLTLRSTGLGLADVVTGLRSSRRPLLWVLLALAPLAECLLFTFVWR